MQKKYAIMSGQYSDWHINGYVSNLEDAYKYCAWKNSIDKYDEYYPVEISCLDGDQKIDISFKYKYRTVFDFRNESWVVRDIDIYDVKPTSLDSYFNVVDGKNYMAILGLELSLSWLLWILTEQKRLPKTNCINISQKNRGYKRLVW